MKTNGVDASALSHLTCLFTFKSNGQPCYHPAKDIIAGIPVCGVHRGRAIAENLASDVEPPISVQEGSMHIEHYVLADDDKGRLPATRIITNVPTPRALAAIKESKALNGRPVPVLKADGVTPSNFRIMNLDTGAYRFPLLQLASDRGVKFRVTFMSEKFMKAHSPEDCLRLVQNANFAWGDADNSAVIHFEDMPDGYWGLDPLGINIENAKKLQKRLNEICRMSRHFHEGEIIIREFVTPQGMDDIFFDGGNAVSEEFARKMGFKGVRMNLRALGPDHLLKGDGTVVKDLNVDGVPVDILYHTQNAKPEISTTGFMLATAEDHEPMHMVRHDDQSVGNFSFFLNETVIRGDIIAMVESYKKSIAEGGDLFNYLADSSKAFDDPLAIDIDLIQMSDTLEDQGDALEMVGIPKATFANIPFTRLDALGHKMRSSLLPDTDVHKRMFIPARNAVVGSVSTWEFCTVMCGMTFLDPEGKPREDGTRIFYDSRVGLVIPGKRFKETYDLHGGHDGDDTWCLYKIRVYCSDPVRLAALRKYFVLDSSIAIPAHAEDAVEVALVIRRPNGPGEYSIEAIAPDMPWELHVPEDVQTYDLAGAPKCQAEVFANTVFDVLPESVDYDRPFDREAGLAMIQAQLQNPKFGSFANVLMCWMQVFNGDRLPASMIGKVETVVDCVQQTADEDAFIAITNSVNDMWLEFRDTVIDLNARVDPILLKTRVREAVKIGDTWYPIQQAIIDANCVAGGYHVRTQKLYNKAIAKLDTLAKITAAETRNRLPMAKKIQALEFDTELMAFADRWLGQMNPNLRRVTNKFNNSIPKDANAILRRRIQVEKREAIEAFMDDAVHNLIINERRDEHKAVLAMYKWITTPREGFPNGDIDRIFVQPTSKGQVSMLQLFIEAVDMEGFLFDWEDDEDES